MSSSSPEIPEDLDIKPKDEADTSNATHSKKRKRDTAQTDELEIDVSLPEPPSKKALRKAKKQKDHRVSDSAPGDQLPQPTVSDPANASADKDTASSHSKSSPYSIWIGNLPFNATKPMLRTFFTAAQVSDDSITRINMPVPRDTGPASKTRLKPQNKGFAYVDFSTPDALATALTLSETSLGGRRVLIKAAKDFAGRPVKTSATAAAVAGGAPGVDGSKVSERAGGMGGKAAKQPTRRVFVGNLGFDVTKEELEAHFAVCGAVEQVFMATFEDSGKCKGFAWVSFEDIDAAASAVQGWVQVDGWSKKSLAEDQGEGDAVEADGHQPTNADDTLTTKKKPKPRKWFINRLQGRTLRCEFAEDATTRYNKRYGKGKENENTSSNKPSRPTREKHIAIGAVDGQQTVAGEIESSIESPGDRRGLGINPGAPSDANKRRGRTDKSKRVHDETKYRTGAITEATGQKVTFD